MTEVPPSARPDSRAPSSKAAVRARLLAARRALDPAAASAAAEAVRDLALRDLAPPDGASVGGYWPMRGELDPRPLLAVLAARGHTVALPVTPPPDAPPLLTFRVWDSDPDTLEDGPFKTRQPTADAPPCDPDWLLVPLVGFDRRGVRLGYGGGFYDRYLLARRGGRRGVTAVGLGFAAQEVPLFEGGLPAEPHDIPLAAVLTEAGVIHPETP